MSNSKLPQGYQVVDQDGSYLSDAENVSRDSFVVEPNEKEPISFEDSYLNFAANLITSSVQELFSSDPRIRRQALKWLLDEEERPPSVVGGARFCWICSCWEVEPSYLLRKLRREAAEKVLKKAKKKISRLKKYLDLVDGFLQPADIDWIWAEAKRLKFKDEKEVKNE